MQKTTELLNSIGQLVKAYRSQTMDQQELATRVGLGRNTISAIENGKGVNAESLLRVLEHLQLIDDIQALVEDKLDQTSVKLRRKSRKSYQELNNDF